MSSVKIKDLPTTDVKPAMKIPTGGFGDYSVTIKFIAEWIINEYDLSTITALNLKADKDKTYTKEEVDYLISIVNGQRTVGRYIQATRGDGLSVDRDSYFTIIPLSTSNPSDNSYFVIGDIICNTDPTSSSWSRSICTKTGYANTNDWSANTAYALSDLVNSNGNVYRCIVAGTTQSEADNAPKDSTNGQVDGTVTWDFYGTQATFRVEGIQISGLTSSSTTAEIVEALKNAGLAS